MKDTDFVLSFLHISENGYLDALVKKCIIQHHLFIILIKYMKQTPASKGLYIRGL